MEKSVFNRDYSSNDNLIGPSTYNLVIGLTLLWGFFVNWLVVKTVPVSVVMKTNFLVFMIGYLVSCFLGTYLVYKSNKPWISFFGYNLIVLPFGFVINIVVSQYDPNLIFNAIQLTMLVTFGMMALGTMFPAFFQKISRTLFIALFLVFIIETIQVFFFGKHYAILDCVVVVIFCGYIGFDWARANMIPKTIDNAIDSAAALYVDIINVFIRLISILGRRD